MDLGYNLYFITYGKYNFVQQERTPNYKTQKDKYILDKKILLVYI